MNRFVVDASVAVKWYLPEQHGDRAARLCRSGTALEAPDLLHGEVGNALWKRVRRGELTRDEAGTIIAALSRMPIEVYPSRLLAIAALQIACETNLTVYDSLYIATAMLTGSRLVTADRRVYQTAREAAPLKHQVLWVEDIPL
ncbi:MAG: type II toxin-antitoxin system VapC family toxin [Candidatus Methylomirabilia bacterium]